MTPEGRVKAKVNRALARINAYRFMPVQNGMGAPGLDYYCCFRSAFFAIETKAPGKKLTERQEATAANIVGAGGAVYVIRDNHDIEMMMAELHQNMISHRVHDRL